MKAVAILFTLYIFIMGNIIILIANTSSLLSFVLAKEKSKYFIVVFTLIEGMNVQPRTPELPCRPDSCQTYWGAVRWQNLGSKQRL